MPENPDEARTRRKSGDLGKEGQSKTKTANREARCGTTALARRHHGVENERGGGSHNLNRDESKKLSRIGAGDPYRKTPQEDRFARNTKRSTQPPGTKELGAREDPTQETRESTSATHRVHVKTIERNKAFQRRQEQRAPAKRSRAG